MPDAAHSIAAAWRRSVQPVRSLARLLATALLLCRRLGFRNGLTVTAQVVRQADVVRFPDAGRWYHVRYDTDVASHILASTSKLRRLAQVVTAEDEVIIDLGAHSGLFTAFAKERSPRAFAVVVEPDPVMRPIIEKNLEPHAGWRVMQRAVSSEGGTAAFYRNLGATQTSSLIEESARTFAGEVERVDVEVATLDEIVAELEIDRVDVLKLDVQGAERMVLAGATGILPKVSKLIVEVTFLDPDPAHLLGFLGAEFGAPETLNPVYMGADLLYRRRRPVSYDSGD